MSKREVNDISHLVQLLATGCRSVSLSEPRPFGAGWLLASQLAFSSAKKQLIDVLVEARRNCPSCPKMNVPKYLQACLEIFSEPLRNGSSTRRVFDFNLKLVAKSRNSLTAATGFCAKLHRVARTTLCLRPITRLLMHKQEMKQRYCFFLL